MRMIARYLLPVLLCSSAAVAADHLVMTVELTSGTSDCPMIVAWVVDGNGTFVRTVHWFSKDKKYMKDLTSWTKGRDGHEDADPLDAVIGPTIKWEGTQTANIPLEMDGVNLLDGSYTLRIEQRKDKAGHYKSTKIPLGPDFTGFGQNDVGYIKTLSIELK